MAGVGRGLHRIDYHLSFRDVPKNGTRTMVDIIICNIIIIHSNGCNPITWFGEQGANSSAVGGKPIINRLGMRPKHLKYF